MTWKTSMNASRKIHWNTVLFFYSENFYIKPRPRSSMILLPMKKQNPGRLHWSKIREHLPWQTLEKNTLRATTTGIIATCSKAFANQTWIHSWSCNEIWSVTPIYSSQRRRSWAISQTLSILVFHKSRTRCGLCSLLERGVGWRWGAVWTEELRNQFDAIFRERNRLQISSRSQPLFYLGRAHSISRRLMRFWVSVHPRKIKDWP